MALNAEIAPPAWRRGRRGPPQEGGRHMKRRMDAGLMVSIVHPAAFQR